MKNLGAYLIRPKLFEFKESETYAIGSNDVLISMKRVGICGSDVHYYKTGTCATWSMTHPFILGHESSGVIEDVGSSVKHLKKGDRVAIEPGVSCRQCTYCLTGRYNLCSKMVFLSAFPVDGSLQKYLVHDSIFCHKLPDRVTFDEGALMEPLAVGVHACRRAGIMCGHNVLVVGAGPIGLICMIVAYRFGANHVTITDIQERRLEFARSHYKCSTINTMDKSFDQIKLELKYDPDVVIECSGSDQGTEFSLNVAKTGGTVVLVGIGNEIRPVSTNDVLLREINIVGVYRYANCYPIAIEMVSSGLIDVTPLITHHVPFNDVEQAFQMCANGEGIKIMIDLSN